MTPPSRSSLTLFLTLSAVAAAILIIAPITLFCVTAAPAAAPKPTPSSTHPASFEFRNRTTGQLEAILSYEHPTPIKTPAGSPIPGKFRGTAISANYYFSNGRQLQLAADTCEVTADPATMRLLTLTFTGNVRLTVSQSVPKSKPAVPPLEIFFDGSATIDAPAATLTTVAPLRLHDPAGPIIAPALHLAVDRPTYSLLPKKSILPPLLQSALQR